MLRIVYIRQWHSFKELQILIDIRKNPQKLTKTFGKHLSNSNPAVRYRVARFLGTLANENMSEFFNFFYTQLYELHDAIGADSARCGVAELLAQFEGMEPQKIIPFISLLAPMALRLSSDPLPTIRQTASVVFGKFVALLALQNVRTFFLT